MKERAYIYAGETVVLRFEARKEGQILDLSGYDVEIDIATTAMGTHLVKPVSYTHLTLPTNSRV